MSICTEVKREYKKLLIEIDVKQRRLKALEGMMKEYKIWHYPKTSSLSEMIINFIEGQNGSASFESIVQFLAENTIEIAHQKLSMVLTKCARIHYNRNTQKWENNPPMVFKIHDEE